jgi:hypothetical protein
MNRPPSIDREGISGEMIVFGLLGILAVIGIAVIGIAVLVTGGPNAPIEAPATQTNPEGIYQFDDLMKERQRAEAYQAVRDYLDKNARGPSVVGVYCRDSTHRPLGIEIEFKGGVDLEYEGGGGVDLEYEGGGFEKKRYTARLVQYAEAWTVTAMQIDGEEILNR